MYRKNPLIILSFRLLIVLSLGLFVFNVDSQNSNNMLAQTYQIIRNIDPNFAIQGEWSELWQTYDENDNLLEMVLIEGQITPNEITSTCDYIWQDAFNGTYQYEVDGEPVDNVDITALQVELLRPFDEQTSYINTRECESTSLNPRNSFDTNQCDFTGTDTLPSLIASTNFAGTRWTENSSDNLISYLVNTQDNDVNFATRFEFVVNDVQTNDEVVLDCFADPLALPETSVVRSYTPQSFVVVDTLNTVSENQNFFLSALLSTSWIPTPGSTPTDNPQHYIGGLGGLCQLDVTFRTYPNSPNSSTAEISVSSNDVSTATISNIAESATNSPVVSAGVSDLDGDQQRLEGEVRDNAETLIDQFRAERWIVHEELTIIYDDTALITLVNDNYILHILVEDIGSNQVEARYQLRELTCGSTFYPSTN